jgi:phosphoribosylformylglycinamidine cyclo-ligase
VGDLRYADAGVDIDEGNRAVALIKRTVASTFTAPVLGQLGAFSGLFAFDTARWRQPVLVASADGVGTKIKIAIAVGRHRGIGSDLVNHCINDILCCGAEPMFFLDYFATGKLRPEQLAEIVEGIADGCRAAGCALIGGETAEMPGVYGLGDYDLAGFIVGGVERDEVIDGSHVQAGDAVVALPSSGLHTNGYSLVRHIVANREIAYDAVLPGTAVPLSDLLLEPHRSYLPAIRAMRAGGVDLRAIAHITGGGLKENIPRALPQGLGVELERSSWEVPAIFRALQETGGIHPAEMWRTFNMGVGMVIVIPQDQVAAAQAAEPAAWRVGRVVENPGPERVVLR